MPAFAQHGAVIGLADPPGGSYHVGFCLNGAPGQNLRLRQVGGEKVCQGEQGLGQGFHRVLIQETGPTGGDHHRVHYDVGRLIGPKAAGDGLDERGGGDHTDLHRVRGNVGEHRVNLLL